MTMAAVAAALAWLAGAGLTFLPPWQAVELRMFDLATVATAPRKSALPITIVAIDEASFASLGQRWPWPRDLHARVIDRLAESGAAVIAFDVLFAESATRAEDEAFARAIAKAGNVVLTADRGYHETATTRQWLRTDPLPLFTRAGATAGLATMALDSDAVARRMSDAEDAFWRQAIAALARARPGTVQEPHVPRGAMMRHLGPTHTFPYVSYYQVLNGDPGIPADFFADQIVLIGRDVRASPEIGGAQADTFATPFLMTSGLLTPGVEIQATQIENALMGQTLERAATRWNLLALSAALLAAFPALLYWHPLRSALIAAAVAAACAGASLWLFSAANLWLAPAAPVLAVGLAFVSTGIGWYFIERRRAGDIRSAFAKYVSSEVVEEMIAHPERLRLGGQRREITVLFCDLAGFTSMSERLSPDAVADVINAFLSEMTRVIMKRGGTVDKFLGDAVMAFWGAPLDDAAARRARGPFGDQDAEGAGGAAAPVRGAGRGQARAARGPELGPGDGGQYGLEAALRLHRARRHRQPRLAPGGRQQGLWHRHPALGEHGRRPARRDPAAHRGPRARQGQGHAGRHLHAMRRRRAGEGDARRVGGLPRAGLGRRARLLVAGGGARARGQPPCRIPRAHRRLRRRGAAARLGRFGGAGKALSRRARAPAQNR